MAKSSTGVNSSGFGDNAPRKALVAPKHPSNAVLHQPRGLGGPKRAIILDRPASATQTAQSLLVGRTQMANIGTLLKSEIARLCRREIRAELRSVKKVSAAHRRHIAALKRQIAALERKAGMLVRQSARTAEAVPSSSTETTARFQARGLRSLRKRLGISQAQLAKLLGVSGLTVYNWESGKASPRKERLAAIVALRSIGKRELQERLEGASKSAGKKTARAPGVRSKRAPAVRKRAVRAKRAKRA